MIWTPQGYYAASPDGDKLVGWHINRGADKAAEYVTAAQLHQRFYRPAIVAQAVLLGSAKQAALADKTDARVTANSLPPLLEKVEHRLNERGEVDVTLHFAEGREADEVAVYVNGSRVRTRLGVLPPSDYKNVRIVRSIPLLAGQDNHLALKFSRGKVESAQPYDLVIAAPLSAKPAQGNLYLLAVGVDKYPAESGLQPLAYAGKDAQAIYKFLKAQEGGLFARVEGYLLAAPLCRMPTQCARV